MIYTSIEKITIICGIDKDGSPEPVKEVEIRKGEIVSLVGPTGSGKSCLMSDLDKLAQKDTITGRQILINYYGGIFSCIGEF